jgi:cellulose biosynthesis protein BcsQ
MIRFDEAVPNAVGLLRAKFLANKSSEGTPADQFPTSYIVRDISGSVVVVLPDSALINEEWDEFAKELHVALVPYSAGDSRVLLRESDLIDEKEILESPDRIALELPNSWLIDRLLTNQDWVRSSLRNSPRVPTAVAFSVKGGVGRSTAFSMLAWYLARQGKNVMVIDLDLEAPGIGEILLQNLPENGLVDWLVESMSGQGDLDFLQSAIGESPIGQEENGWIHVIPAYGTNTKNFISKLGRVYASSFDIGGNMLGLAERLDLLLDSIQKLADPPDVVLLDSRAGLHDIGSAAVTRLGAEVFLFARNDDQNWWAYRQIFDHLKLSSSVAKGMGDDDDLRWKIKMVAAQTAPTDAARRDWIERSYSEWMRFYDDESAPPSLSFQPEVFAKDDVEAPHHPLFVNFDVGVRSLSIKDNDVRPNWEFVQGIFGDFFIGAEQRLWPNDSSDDQGMSRDS